MARAFLCGVLQLWLPGEEGPMQVVHDSSLTGSADLANSWASTIAYRTSDGAAAARTFNSRLHGPLLHCLAR
jgi:hypothetical protein